MKTQYDCIFNTQLGQCINSVSVDILNFFVYMQTVLAITMLGLFKSNNIYDEYRNDTGSAYK